jgi:putative ABC transport system substrate-binding protein
LVLASCSSSATSSDARAGSTASAGKRMQTIGIALTSSFKVIDDNVAAFKAELAKKGYVEGKNVKYVTKNAQGQVSNISLVARSVVDTKPDLIFTLGTNLDLAIAKLEKTRPILFSVSTDPKGAGLVPDIEAPGGNVSGTSDFIDPATYFKYLQLAVPSAKRVGLIGNTAEQNTAIQIKSFQDQAAKLGLRTEVAPVSSTNDIVPAIRSLAGRVDVLLVGADATLTSTDKVVLKAAAAAKLPVVFNGSEEAANGALVGIGPNYTQLGTISGDQAAEVLGGKNPGDIPVAFPGPLGLVIVSVNKKVAAEYHLTLSPELTANASVVGS